MYHEEARERARLEGEQMKAAEGGKEEAKPRAALEIPDHLLQPPPPR
jgi:hypothetical protein